ncbi:phage tail protein [Photobacterium makurazakiensis]|uniref:phage tail-collar fiber domain-containing protein n=1 Tax=Photobacterium makurazakiensis TaxID=2910234 RepID=UPI003D09E56A
MANVTDKSILTAAGKALLAQLNAEEKALVIDKMIFANVPNRPEYPQPDDVVPSNDVVYEAAVEQRGRLSVDSVIYSTTLTSQEGPFEFNWTGAYCSEYGVLVTIDHHALTPKTADEPGVAGNTLVRSVVLEYKDIAEITNITVDASTWQYNATPRMKKMDDDVAQANIDQNGKDWFIEDGFLVTPQASAFNIKAGASYVSGNRVMLEFDRNVQVPNKPSFIYVDAHREGTPTGEQVTLFDFVVTAEEKDDYTDVNGVKHFVCKIAQVFADGSVSDLRVKGLFDYLPWSPGMVVTNPNKRFFYIDEDGRGAVYRAPLASKENPIIKSALPDDKFINVDAESTANNNGLLLGGVVSPVDGLATLGMTVRPSTTHLVVSSGVLKIVKADGSLGGVDGEITHLNTDVYPYDATIGGVDVWLGKPNFATEDVRFFGLVNDNSFTQDNVIAAAMKYTSHAPKSNVIIPQGFDVAFDYLTIPAGVTVKAEGCTLRFDKHGAIKLNARSKLYTPGTRIYYQVTHVPATLVQAADPSKITNEAEFIGGEIFNTSPVNAGRGADLSGFYQSKFDFTVTGLDMQYHRNSTIACYYNKITISCTGSEIGLLSLGELFNANTIDVQRCNVGKYGVRLDNATSNTFNISWIERVTTYGVILNGCRGTTLVGGIIEGELDVAEAAISLSSGTSGTAIINVGYGRQFANSNRRVQATTSCKATTILSPEEVYLAIDGAITDVGLGWELGNRVNAEILACRKPLILPPYSKETLPSAAGYGYGLVMVTNATGGSVPAFSDGARWRSVIDREVVS